MIRNSFFIVLFAIATFSCKKFLDKKSDDRLATPSTLADLQALLDNATELNLLRTPALIEVSSDDYFWLENNFNAAPTNLQEAYTWKLKVYDFGESGNDWSKNYLPVYNANVCLDALKNIERTNSNGAAWNNVKGSALFYRSYYFLQLAWAFANTYDESTSTTDLGIVLRLTSDPYAPSVRSTVRQTYDQIIQDTKEAAAYLPVAPVHPMRPSKVAAYGLLARAYLSMRDYENAFKYSDSALKLKGNLMDFKVTCPDPCDVYSTSATASTPFKKFNSETVFYTEMATTYTIHRPGTGRVDTALYQSFTTNDLRRNAYFLTQNPYRRFKGSYSQGTVLFTGIATDELYLIRAECYARSGDKVSALADLNLLLSKRYNSTFVPITATDANDALNKILIERRKELMFRGLRWADIKRLNKEGRNIILMRYLNGTLITLSPNSNYYALPIPDDIIRQTGIQQNPQ